MAVQNFLYALCREPQGVTLGMRPLSPALSKNSLKPARHCLFNNGFLSPPPSTYTLMLTRGFPPISSLLQSSPSRYFSNQAAIFSSSRRRITVCPSCFSQTTILHHSLVRASTSISEWVVTINWLRSDASSNNLLTVGSMSGWRPSSGSSIQMSGGGCRMAEDGRANRGTAAYRPKDE